MRKFPGFWNKNNEGPPDLDEVFKDLNQKLNRMFGGKGGQGSPKGNSPAPQPLPIAPILGLVALIWLGSGFYIVDQGSRGVVLRFGKHVETTTPGPRWHLPFPIETVENVNLEQVRTIELGYRSFEGESGRSKEPRESLMLTDDENIIDLQVAVQYNLKSVEDFQFSNRSTEESVRGIAETAIREIAGKSKMDFVLYEGRDEVAAKAKKLMQEMLDRYKSGVHVVNVTMQNAQPPEQVQAAFDDAVKAKQDLERQKNEGQAYANDVIPKARGTAARLSEEASGYKLRVENEAKGNADRFEQILTQYNKAPEVTRQRLYIDAQEHILANTSKVLVDQKGGNSLLYLPLDKLMGASGAGGSSNTAPAAEKPAQESSQSSDAGVLDRTRDAMRSRDREYR
ncbi:MULTISPECIES: FtsH protease activity modulator HflK [unclassified Methylophilus]|uniref:FtsH protease activity modulator HflK n=1 Tax=unclassified Methylophilus TaxID=2630143 RepID=UPI000701B8DE|nr:MULTISPECIES: FtsH protease activity modulator HflK [unclassified Methylophilus]KQT43360.1 HflK protein [Methylophilus sp. Leaf416]KQT58845.1 HflK protein [Methylophilus sp. Leaf459]